MKLNGVETSISSYTSEALNNEIVIYNEEDHKVIVLNPTAALVWKEITESQNKTDSCTKDIASMLMKVFNVPESNIDTVCSDVDETIELLFQASLLRAI